jgi:hypothetical protein
MFRINNCSVLNARPCAPKQNLGGSDGQGHTLQLTTVRKFHRTQTRVAWKGLPGTNITATL